MRKGGLVLALSGTLQVTEAIFGGKSSEGQNFEYDYCSIGHSLQVYEDTANNFNEVFGGYEVPMDPYMCPFHPNNLAYLRDKNQLQNWRTSKIGPKGTVTCPICSKVFKTQDFYELHLKTHHSGSSLLNYNFSLGQENKLPSSIESDKVSSQGSQFCLADYCDIIPCDFYSITGNPATKARNKIISNLKDTTRVSLKTNTFRSHYNPTKSTWESHQTNQWRGLDRNMNRDSLDLMEQKCSKLILDCVDWRHVDAQQGDQTIANVGNMYDLLYQVYCSKLTREGSDIQSERALRDFILESKQQRKAESSTFTSSTKEKPWYKDDAKLIKYLLAGFAVIMAVLYYCVLYFTIFDKDQEAEERLRDQAKRRRMAKQAQLNRTQNAVLPQQPLPNRNAGLKQRPRSD